MKLHNLILFIFLFFSLVSYAGTSEPDSLSTNLKTPTSYAQYVKFLQNISEVSPIVHLEWMANSFEGRKIPYVLISRSNLLKNNKLKFLIFASQHGNEPSGKEALLFLIKDFASGKYSDVVDKIDLILVPQVNPDGGELQQRHSANDVDLNRSHVLLQNPETEGLHRLFNKYLPQITLDIHETNFYKKNWLNYGFIKTYTQQMGLLANPNIDRRIIDYSNNTVLPFVKKFVEEKGYSFHNYILGNVYKGEPIRHSNLGIYDGRQSFGILNSLSFLIEGKNGKTINSELNRRRDGQLANILALIDFAAENAAEIQDMVAGARNKLIHSKEGDLVSIRSVYKLGPDSIDINLHDIKNGKDTVIAFPYESQIVSTLNVKKPKGYLIENYDYSLRSLLDKHNIKYQNYKHQSGEHIYQYFVLNDTVKVDKNYYLNVNKLEVTKIINYNDFLFVPINQLASNLITLIFEPQSMSGPNSKYGIIPGRKIKYFLNRNNSYKILRVESN